MPTEKDFCARCGSKNIEIMEKSIHFKLPNPGEFNVIQSGMVCKECGDTYFNSKQIEELSNKVNDAKSKK